MRSLCNMPSSELFRKEAEYKYIKTDSNLLSPLFAANISPHLSLFIFFNAENLHFSVVKPANLSFVILSVISKFNKRHSPSGDLMNV